MAGMKPGYTSPQLFKALCLLLGLASPPTLSHAGGLADTLANTLAEALAQAWQRHPPAVALNAGADEVRARAEIAQSLTAGPAELSVGHLTDALNDDRGKREWEVELAAPLWLPGQRATQRAQAASLIKQLGVSETVLRLELAGELRAAWWMLAAARQANDLAERRLASARSLEADVMRRYRAGDLARIDANQARGESLAAQAESLRAERALRQAERAWQSLTETPAPAVLATELAPISVELSPAHPALAALASASELARIQFKLAQTVSREAPQLALRMQRERGDAREVFGHAIGVKLSIPFASEPRQRRDAAAARADAMQVEAEQIRRVRQLTLAIEQAKAELDAAEQHVQMARQQQELTRDSVQLAEKSFALGESGLTGLLRARATAFEAEAELNHQVTAHARAISQLKQALGELP
jgi:outer membrane protein, heavy metal efflux system